MMDADETNNDNDGREVDMYVTAKLSVPCKVKRFFFL